MEKSPEAFRTISEVADLLDTPAHVLRFWESRFPQIRPVKRAGGRRYYRPGDVALLSGIKRLLHDDGMTIRGVQKILREHGVRHVAGLSTGEGTPPAEDDVETALAAALGPERADDGPPTSPIAGQTAQIISLERAIARSEGADDPPDLPAAEPEPTSEAPFVEVDGGEAADIISFSGTDQGLADRIEPPAQDMSTGPEDDIDPAMTDPAEATLASALRRLRVGDLADRQEALITLQARMIDLRDRLAAASRRRVR